MGWITTKCPQDFAEDSFSKRLRNLQNTIKAEKLVDANQVDKMFDSVVNNNHFEIFKKVSGNEEIESTEIKKIFKSMSLLVGYEPNKDHLSEKMVFTG